MTCYQHKVVNKQNWRSALKNLKDQDALEHFLQELEQGHDLGLVSDPSKKGSIINPPMDRKSKIKMSKTILKWHKKNYLLGPFKSDHPIVNQCRINPVFTVPKPGDEVRPVVNYSKRIDGHSLNEMLVDQWCTVEYLKIQEIVYIITLIGIGAVIWAKDLEDGYFNVKMDPSQIQYMAFTFMGLIFIPMVMLFGLSSAPLIFTVFMWYVISAIRLADPALTFLEIPKEKLKIQYFQQEKDIVYKKDTVLVPLIVYYLDDIFGIHRSSKIYDQYNLAGRILSFLGLSAKQSKDRPPSTVQQLLGLEYDTIQRVVRTPRVKGLRYIAFANKLMAQKSITKKLLFSLTGKVRHASGQCRPLNAFARGVEAYGHKVKFWTHHINVTRNLKRDIKLMTDGLYHSLDRGISFDTILDHRDVAFDINAFTDAAGKYGGIGGFVEIDHAPYFQVAWSDLNIDIENIDIQWKEMIAIFVLIDLMKEEWRNKTVRIWCDNEPVVWMLIKWRSPLHRTDLQAIIREIARICIFNDINPWWEHLEGDTNVTADNLSRFKQNPFDSALVSPGKDLSKIASKSLKSACRFCLM